MPGSTTHVLSKHSTQRILMDLSNISLLSLCMLDALLNLERGKAKGKAMSLDGKMVVNPQGKGMRALGMTDRPRSSEAEQILQQKGSPTHKRNLHSSIQGSRLVHTALLCMVSCQLWFQGSSWCELRCTFIILPLLLQQELTKKETTGILRDGSKKESTAS